MSPLFVPPTPDGLAFGVSEDCRPMNFGLTVNAGRLTLIVEG